MPENLEYRITVRVRRKIYDNINTIAEVKDLRKSDVIRDALEEYFK